MHKVNEKYLTSLGFAIALIILTTIAAISYRSIGGFLERVREVDHTHQVRLEIQELLSLCLAMRIAWRSYIVSGDSRYLEDFAAGAGEIHDKMQSLGRLLADQQRLAILRGLVAQDTAAMEASMALKKAGRLGSAEQILVQFSAAGLNFPEINRLAQAMQDAARERLAERKRESEAGATRTIFAILGGNAAGFSLLALTFGFLDRETRRRREAQRAAQNYTKEISSLNEELKHHTGRLEAANKELESFSYSVSHDLRAPLRAIDGFSRILEEDYQAVLDDEGRRILNVIRDNSAKMAQLIDDLLAFSRSGRSPVAAEAIDMTALAQEVFAELQGTAEGKPVPPLVLQPMPPAWGDRKLLRQVWVNLLANAVKFSGTQAQSLVEAGGRTEDQENVYYVKDNGVGFDMRYYQKLFGVFQRLHSTEEFPGTGVGLAIVQRVVLRHGGRVWAESRLNQGATFYFTLPRGKDNVRAD